MGSRAGAQSKAALLTQSDKRTLTGTKSSLVKLLEQRVSNLTVPVKQRPPPPPQKKQKKTKKKLAHVLENPKYLAHFCCDLYGNVNKCAERCIKCGQTMLTAADQADVVSTAGHMTAGAPLIFTCTQLIY